MVEAGETNDHFWLARRSVATVTGTESPLLQRRRAINRRLRQRPDRCARRCTIIVLASATPTASAAHPCELFERATNCGGSTLPTGKRRTDSTGGRNGA